MLKHFQERQEKYQFIKYHKLKFPVEKMCNILKVSRSSYYNWLKCRPSKRWLANERIMFSIQKNIQAVLEETNLEKLDSYSFLCNR